MNDRPSNDPTDPDVARTVESLDLRDAMIAGLAAGANDLTCAARDLAHSARLTRLEKIVAVSLLAVNMVIGAIVAVSALLLLDLTDGTRSVTQSIEDCVTPGSACYEQEARRDQETIDRIERGQVLAIVCAREFKDPVEFERCVTERTDALDE